MAGCPNNCGGQSQGQCNASSFKCTCNAGFSGRDCSIVACPDDCNFKGLCVAGVCMCRNGYTGRSCAEKVCLNECYGHGSCDTKAGRCKCLNGWGGRDCGSIGCPLGGANYSTVCSGNGTCDMYGACNCSANFTGTNCEQAACKDDCNRHGLCSNGTCYCDKGYMGESCEQGA